MTEPAYPPWPPPSPRRFVWWEALLGLVAPSVLAGAILLLMTVALVVIAATALFTATSAFG